MTKCSKCEEELGDPIEEYEHQGDNRHRIVWKLPKQPDKKRPKTPTPRS
jgi:hypothetical protein